MYNLQNTQCQFCKVATLATIEHLQSVHVQYAVCFTNGTSGKQPLNIFANFYYSIDVIMCFPIESFAIPCHCEKKANNRSHWHCPTCKCLSQRKHTFESHLKTHGTFLHRRELIVNLILVKE